MAITLYTTDDDFKLTKTIITESIANKKWAKPIFDESVALNLEAIDEPPVYIPLGQYINMNKPDPNIDQGTRLDQESDIAVQLTHLSKQLIRSTEFVFYKISGDNVDLCPPKHVKNFDQYWVDTRVAEANVRAFATSLSAKTIQNCRDVAKAIVLKHADDLAFREKMRSNNENERAAYFGNLATPAMKYFIFRNQFQALKFAFIFHKATRSVPAEETIRQNLCLRVDFITATMLYTTYAHRLQVEAAKPFVNRDEIPGTNDAILVAYKLCTSRNPLAHLPKNLTLLPVTRDILSKKNLTTPKNNEAEAFPDLDENFN
ncbi:hypothetical protein V491_06844 [Pseudogymnoascus sp. VKM F-3775]|nr:hypothetical protein V491_06844 [Pseudogymnoascus sp. VKM F-3775]